MQFSKRDLPYPVLPLRSTLQPRSKGCHLVTKEVEKNIKEGLSGCKIGILHLFIKHTSAALTINENCDPGELEMRFDVRSSRNSLILLRLL